MGRAEQSTSWALIALQVHKIAAFLLNLSFCILIFDEDRFDLFNIPCVRLTFASVLTFSRRIGWASPTTILGFWVGVILVLRAFPPLDRATFALVMSSGAIVGLFIGMWLEFVFKPTRASPESNAVKVQDLDL